MFFLSLEIRIAPKACLLYGDCYHAYMRLGMELAFEALAPVYICIHIHGGIG
jgi:hypothetical protein